MRAIASVEHIIFEGQIGHDDHRVIRVCARGAAEVAVGDCPVAMTAVMDNGPAPRREVDAVEDHVRAGNGAADMPVAHRHGEVRVGDASPINEARAVGIADVIVDTGNLAPKIVRGLGVAAQDARVFGGTGRCSLGAVVFRARVLVCTDGIDLRGVDLSGVNGHVTGVGDCGLH